MKKLFAVALPVMVVFGLTVASVYSTGNDKACTQETKAATASSKSACCASAKTTDAKMTSAKECPVTGAQMTGTDVKCDYPGDCAVRTISIKGMTCAGCEQSVTTALMKVPGVVKVASISYKDEKAVVCIDPSKCKDEASLTKAVADKGYAAEIIPAVAKTSEVMDNASSCTPAQKAACGSKVCSGVKKTTETSDKGAASTK